ncbi:MAG: phosphorylase, partial [Pseudomonadota bacterium]
RAAQGSGAAFLAIRAIADPADRTLPSAALNAVNKDGSTKVFSTLVNAARDPGQFPALLQLGQDSSNALSTLSGNLGGLLGALFLRGDLV